MERLCIERMSWHILRGCFTACIRGCVGGCTRRCVTHREIGEDTER